MGGDEGCDEEPWGDDSWGSSYLRSPSALAMLVEKPIDITERYKAIAENDGSGSSRLVPIEELIIKDAG